jgi:hypothetical protein
MAEAREAALAELLPPAIASLRAHINGGDPSAWRASLRVLELAFPRTAEPEPPELPTDVDDVLSLGWQELRLLAARMTIEPLGDDTRELLPSPEKHTNRAHDSADR